MQLKHNFAQVPNDPVYINTLGRPLDLPFGIGVLEYADHNSPRQDNHRDNTYGCSLVRSHWLRLQPWVPDSEAEARACLPARDDEQIIYRTPFQVGVVQ